MDGRTGLVSFDLETWPIERCRLAPAIVCGGWATARYSQILLSTSPAFDERVEEMLTGPSLIVGANPAFDMECLCAHEPRWVELVFAAYEAGRVHDILLREKMIAIAQGLETEREPGLASVSTSRGLHVDKSSKWRLEYPSLINVPVEHWPAEAREYLLGDIQTPLKIWKMQENESQVWKTAKGSPLLDRSGEEAYAAFCLYLLSAWGVRTDPQRVRALADATGDRLSEIRQRLVEIGLVRGTTKRNRKGLLVRDPLGGSRCVAKARELAKAACQEAGVSPKLTEKGQICLDEDACLLTGSPDLALYAEYCSADRTQTLLDDLAAGTELPLQARFVSMVDTYRTSSRKPSPPVRGMQMQNFSRHGGHRECFTPREGNVFIVADVSSMEAHYWAQFCHDMGFGDSLLNDLNRGADIHRALAAITYGIPEAEVTKEQRDMAKPGNYGFMGGMAEDTFCLTQRKQTGKPFPRELAVTLRAAWRRLRPETEGFFSYIQRLCSRSRDDKGTLCHPSTGVWRTAHYCSLANFTFQHPSAIGVKRGLLAVQKACYVDRESPLFGCRPWNMIHDEIVAEAPEERAAEAAEELGRLLAAGCNTLLPDCPTSAPPLVCRTWSKGHKPRRDAAGRLQVSE